MDELLRQGVKLDELPQETLVKILKDLPWDDLMRVAQLSRTTFEAAWIVMIDRGVPPTNNWILTAPWDDVVARSARLMRSLVQVEPLTVSDTLPYNTVRLGPPLLWEVMPAEAFTTQSHMIYKQLHFITSKDRRRSDDSLPFTQYWNMSTGFRLPEGAARRQLLILARPEFWFWAIKLLRAIRLKSDGIEAIKDIALLPLWLNFLPRSDDHSWSQGTIILVRDAIIAGRQKVLRTGGLQIFAQYALAYVYSIHDTVAEFLPPIEISQVLWSFISTSALEYQLTDVDRERTYFALHRRMHRYREMWPDLYNRMLSFEDDQAIIRALRTAIMWVQDVVVTDINETNNLLAFHTRLDAALPDLGYIVDDEMSARVFRGFLRDIRLRAWGLFTLKLSLLFNEVRTISWIEANQDTYDLGYPEMTTAWLESNTPNTFSEKQRAVLTFFY